MDWTLYLVCTLISMTSIGCEHNPRMYHQYDRTDNNDGPDDVATKRMSERSIPFDSAQQRLQEGYGHIDNSDGPDDIATQRMSERQRLQDIQRRQHRVDQQTFGVSNSQFNPTRRGLAPHLSMSPDVVVFPAPVRQAATQFEPNVPEECQKKGICEDVPDYPEDHVAKLIEALGNATDKFHVDELDIPEIAQRTGEDTELCEMSYKVVVPTAAPDKTGKWHFIVNKKDKALQGFRVELCKEHKSPCSAKHVHFYTGYEASCKQKFMLRMMSAIDARGKMVDRAFNLPSCCSCVVRQSD